MADVAIGDLVRDLVGEPKADDVTCEELRAVADNPVLLATEIDVVLRDCDLNQFVRQRRPRDAA